LCYFRFVVEQPYSAAGDDRTSIAVTHNCPAELVESIDFSITFSDTEGAYTIVDDDKARTLTGVDGLTADGLACGSLVAKTAAGSATAGDCGVWHPATDAALDWSYSYYVNLTDLFSATAADDATPVDDSDDATPVDDSDDATPVDDSDDATPVDE